MAKKTYKLVVKRGSAGSSSVGVCDIALFHIVASQPQKMGMDIRRERYDIAIAWLEQVASGKLSPDLPPIPDNTGTSAGSLRWGSEKNYITTTS